VESINACKKIINRGIPVLNQTVLLKEINDSSDILKTLFRKLIRVGVKPHYLFHVDPICGVRHFATGVERGVEIMRELRQELSSLAIPMFAIDLPNGGGKVVLEPNFKNGEQYQGVDGELYDY
jgi:lysine 2,3-aminomutase